jgi:hypothetical protein
MRVSWLAVAALAAWKTSVRHGPRGIQKGTNYEKDTDARENHLRG